MFKNLFSFSNATLLVALALSSIAAWYSIIGLTAIFAGAVIPIIIMGSVLEIAKVTTTVWLRKYWDLCSIVMKLYLVPAVVALALLTSMGIFGFLSKAHMDQGVTSGDSQAKLVLFDEKIKTQRDNIELARKALTQMDAQVDQMLGRTDNDRGAERAVAIRKQQAKERTSLQNDIGLAQKEIQKLNEERAPIAAENRKVEAEVGPIKYIAALIYGDNPDQNVLERAVRWVIILLVVVFDPLAIALVIGANQSREWDEKLRKQKESEEVQTILPVETPVIPDVVEEELVVEEPIVGEPEPINCNKCGSELVNAPGIGLFCPNKECDVIDNTKGEEPIEFVVTTPKPIVEEEEVKEVLPEDNVPVVKDNTPNFEGVKDASTGKWIQTGPEFTFEELNATEEPYGKSGDGYVTYEGKSMHSRVLRDLRPDLNITVDDATPQPKTDFGTNFPKLAHLGDTFVRVDVIPNRMFKFNGTKWVETKRENTDVHLSNDEYLRHLIEKIGTGEYDPEHLAPNEQDAVAEFIKKTTK
jgi:hypothetical protein